MIIDNTSPPAVGNGGIKYARRILLAALAETHHNPAAAVELAVTRAPAVAEDIRRLARALKIK